MSGKGKKRVYFVFLLVFILAGIYIFFADNLFSEKKTEISYREFYLLAQDCGKSDRENSAELKDIVLSSDWIDFVKSENGVEKNYRCKNPQSPELKSFLLLNGLDYKEEKDGGEIFSSVMDILFYVIFFGVFIFAFRKFISPNTFKVVKKTGVKFDSVVGMKQLKKDMIQIMDMMKNPETFKKKGIRMPKGILLEGAPGNGKTLFAKALAGEAKVNFIPAKATDFESMFMAIGPMKVKLLFKKARRKAPCIVFIDEFDGIGTRRNYSGSAIETENTRIVTALLNELDGFEPNKGILVLAATNSINALDEALIRPGRFDARVKVPYPDEEARKKLIEMYSKGKSMGSDCSVTILAKRFEGFSCAKIESVINRACMICIQKNKETIDLSDVIDAENEEKTAN